MTPIAVVALAAAVLTVCGPVQRWLTAGRARQRLQASVGPGGVPSVAGLAPVPASVQRAFDEAGLGESAPRLVGTWAATCLVAAAAASTLPSARIVLAVVAVAPPVALLVARGRQARRRTGQLPDALDAVAAGLRGGLALPAAIAGAADIGPPLGDELAAVAREVDGGRPLTEALDRWQRAAVDAHTSLAGAALSVAAEVGGPGARAVDGAAASLRDRLASEAETAALATQGRASAAVLTVAPVAFSFVLASVDPAAGRFLLGTPVGWLCIAAGVTLDAAGAWWMARLVRRAR